MNLARPPARLPGVVVPAFAIFLATAVAHPAVAGQNAPRAATPAAATVYTIGPSDVLQIVVWKEPDLSRDVIVRFDGMITMPLVGDLKAAGMTPGEVARSVTKGLQQFVEAPRVTVGVGQANSARFYVLGQVTKSGEFPLSGNTTILQGLALAGGFRDFAKTESIVVVRGDQTPIPVNYKRMVEGKDVSQNVLLMPGDTVLVP